MTTRKSKAAASSPAAQEGAPVAKAAGVAGAGPAAGGDGIAGGGSPVAPGTSADAAADAVGTGNAIGLALAKDGDATPAALDAGDPNVALATIAVQRIRDAATVEEAFDAVIDAAPLVALVLGFAPFPGAPDHMTAPFEVGDIGVDLAGGPDACALAEMDLTGRVLTVRTIARATRYRADRAWGPDAQPIAVDDLTADELAAILGDGALDVRLVEG